MKSVLPSRRYRHPILDSERWRFYVPREDDIVVATPFKAGTTWMQLILLHLLYDDFDRPLLRDVDHWIDLRLVPMDAMLERLDAQQSRRFIKTHLPLDGLPFFSAVKYIVVSRDPRDAGTSLWNHYSHMDVDGINQAADGDGPPLPACPASFGAFWKNWLTKGWFEWESEGYPFWSNLRHVQTWFEAASSPNVLFVHHQGLCEDLVREVGSIARFLGLAATREKIKAVAEAVRFDNVKRNLHRLFPNGYRSVKGGADTFFHKGTNGRWKDVLSESDLALYDRVADDVLTGDCREWLESGKMHFRKNRR